MPRSLLVFVLVCALAALPALCTGGWLVHPCDCGDSIGCEHEVDCGADPCEMGAARPDDDGAGKVAVVVAVLLPSGGPPLCPAPADPGRATIPVPVLVHDGRPFPAADLPLLN